MEKCEIKLFPRSDANKIKLKCKLHSLVARLLVRTNGPYPI